MGEIMMFASFLIVNATLSVFNFRDKSYGWAVTYLLVAAGCYAKIIMLLEG